MVELKDASTGGTVDCWYWIITEPGNYFPPDTIGGCNIIYQNETVVLNDIGTFTIKLCVSNDDSESSITKTVEVVQFQTYDVYAQMTYIDGCACGRINQQMGFKDQSYADGPIKGIRVDWQDGQTDYFTEAMSAYPPPYYPYLYHTYKNAGHYNIHYWVFGNGTILDDTWAGFNAVNCNSTAYSSGFGGSVHDTWGGADTYYAGTFKVAGSYGAYVVQSNKDITLNACNSVQLLPGFKTQPGCHFVATASDPCLAWKPKNAEKIRKTPVDQPQKQEVAGEWSMLVYPNPNTGIFSIAFGGDIRTIKFVEVVDVLGKVVYKKYNVSENIMEMDFPSSTKGMYLIRAVVNGELVVEKMVIE